MKLIIESKEIARCAETGKEYAITNLNTLKKHNEIVEDKTKPVIKKTVKEVLEFEQIKKEFNQIKED